MNKSEFISLYRKPKITVWFEDRLFLDDDSTQVNQEEIEVEEMLDYFVPKYVKNGELDTRGIDEQIRDAGCLPITVREASYNPAKWGLSPDGRVILELLMLSPIPIATDNESGKSLLLDSNHFIVNLVDRTSKDELMSYKIHVVRITGNELGTLIPDFKILNRRQSTLNSSN